ARRVRDAATQADATAPLLAEIEALRQQVKALERTAAEVSRAKDAAEAANRAKTEFLAMMSHELRTPLNAILGFSEIIRTEALGPLGASEYKEFAGDIYASGAHLLALINDLLDLAKVESGMVELKDEAADVARMLDDCVRIVAKTAASDGVKLASEPAPGLPRLRADKRKLNQVLMNLLSNAVKFTPEGKSVTARAFLNDDGGVTIEVTDTGIGIAPDDIARVQEPFVQIDSALNRAHQGTGLGLPLCKQLTELHGGRFEIESRLGEGTTVRLVMPPDRTIGKSAYAA
ncbi:MAG: HAMP domain-containing sensor histidine kinase, partial [Alphaproteobacteria bacterium]